MCWETCQSYEEPLLDGEEFPFCTTKACEAPKTFILLSPAVTALLPKAKWEFSGCESAVCCVRPALCWALREWRPLGRGDPECSGSEELFSLSFFLFTPLLPFPSSATSDSEFVRMCQIPVFKIQELSVIAGLAHCSSAVCPWWQCVHRTLFEWNITSHAVMLSIAMQCDHFILKQTLRTHSTVLSWLWECLQEGLADQA